MLKSPIFNIKYSSEQFFFWRHRGCYRMVVRFSTISAINAYHHYSCERGAQHYVIQSVCELRQVGDFLRILQFPPPIKLTTMI